MRLRWWPALVVLFGVVSAVAANQGGQWLFHSLHFSNLTGPIQAPATK